MAIKRWNASTSQWELVGTPGTVTPAAIGAVSLSGGDTIISQSASSIPLTIQGASSQTANLFDIKNSAGESRYFIDPNGVPTSRAYSPDSTAGFTSERYSTTGDPVAPYAMRGYGGTIASPTTVGADQRIGLLSAVGYDGTSLVNSSRITFTVDGAVSTGIVPGRITFNTQPSAGGGHIERMRIDSSGRVGIGAASVSGMLEITHVDASAPKFISTANNNNKLMVFEGFSGNLWNFWGGHGGGSYFGISENASSTPVFAITGSTNHVLVGYTASQGAYKLQVNSQIFATSSSIATSDGRYKENVFPITSGLDIIDSLNPVSFDWKAHPIHNFVEGKTVGFIAQEVKESLKDYEWVNNIIKTNTTEAVLDEEGNEITPAEEFLGIAESNIIPLLVAAVKELRSELNALKASML